MKLLNFDYACIQGTYWMLYGILSSFASVFLLSRGYSNSEIGVILATANVAAVVLQPLAADLADRSGRVSLIGITQWMTVMMMVMTIGLFTFQKKSLALSAIFVLLICRSAAFISTSGWPEVWDLWPTLSSWRFWVQLWKITEPEFCL